MAKPKQTSPEERRNRIAVAYNYVGDGSVPFQVRRVIRYLLREVSTLRKELANARKRVKKEQDDAEG